MHKAVAMDSLTTTDYIRDFESLNIDSKIELLAKLTDSLKNSYQLEYAKNKRSLLDEVYGAWADSDIDEEAILDRTISERT